MADFLTTLRAMLASRNNARKIIVFIVAGFTFLAVHTVLLGAQTHEPVQLSPTQEKTSDIFQGLYRLSDGTGNSANNGERDIKGAGSSSALQSSHTPPQDGDSSVRVQEIANQVNFRDPSPSLSSSANVNTQSLRQNDQSIGETSNIYVKDSGSTVKEAGNETPKGEIINTQSTSGVSEISNDIVADKTEEVLSGQEAQPTLNNVSSQISETQPISQGEQPLEMAVSQQAAVQIDTNSTSPVDKSSGIPSNPSTLPKEVDKGVQQRKNVLFLVSDDLRPQLEIYKGPYHPNPFSSFKMHTPHLDALGRKSLLLTRAYTQYAVCGPSRTSFMTGRRPDTTRVWDLSTYWRNAGGNFTTIAQYFKENGYFSSSVGKIFHPGTSAPDSDPISWSDKPYHPPSAGHYQTMDRSWVSVNKTVRETWPLPDEDTNREAIKRLQGLAPKALTGEQPFFLAVGYLKPHMPFICPEEFFDLYPLDNIEAAPNGFTPKNMPIVAWLHSEPCSFKDNSQYNCSTNAFYANLPEEIGRQQRRAYFSCVSYIDSLVGDLVAELDHLGLTSNTVISFIGDHGYHLGENGKYGKHTNFEQATHAPFMVHVPGLTDEGVRSDTIVELVDLFPTVAEASGLNPIPACPEESSTIETCTDGVSLLPLVENPSAEMKGFAISQMERWCRLGYSIRTDGFRYTEWQNLAPMQGLELYDHNQDPEENYNMALQNPGKQERDKMAELLHSVIPVAKGFEKFQMAKKHSAEKSS